MITRLLRSAWLALALVILTGFLWMPAPRSPWWMLLLPWALFVTLAAVLACEFALMLAAGRALPDQRPSLSQCLAAWWLELWVTCRLALWRMPVLGNRQYPPCSAMPPIHRGLVLVHGYGCNRGIWSEWLAQLAKRQVPCVAVELEPLFASIDDYGSIIEAAVADMRHRTGRAPVLVAHSMGGLAARMWWSRDRASQRLHRLITIGSPHQGIWMAKFGWGVNARQMRPRSVWLARLRAQAAAGQAQRTLCFYSDCDNLVFPSAAATLPGADNRKIRAVGHVAMVDHPDIFAAALQAVLASD
jgi:pimeloyl-ACP methyl ester carboxylesterase